MTREELERLRADNRIEEVIGQYLELKPGGRCLMAKCPFHPDRTPSLAVFPNTQSWWCFGCNTGGDVFAFIERIENLSFAEALKYLARGDEPQNRPRRPSPFLKNFASFQPLTLEHFTLLTAATEVYHAALFTRHDLLRYLARRGFDAEAVQRFRLGYVSGDDLARYFRYRGWDLEQARDLGLVGPYGEHLRERIVIPELREGRAVYLVGRATLTRQRAKYIGLPGAPKPLYGQAAAQGAAAVFLVEGPFDWLTLVNWGYPARGLLGSHLKREHESELDSAKCIYLALDNDAEGQRAAQILQTQLGARARLVQLPSAIKDVNQLAQQPNGRAIFERLVQQSEFPRGQATCA